MALYHTNVTKDLHEAYYSIYNSHQINEDQILEYFNTWVDNLLYEGYDLSDYTYEQLYEYYIDEGAIGIVAKKLLSGVGSLAKTAWKGSPSKRLNPNYNHGAKETIKTAVSKIGAALPIAVAAGIADQELTGGAGREWLGAGYKLIKDLGHKIPRPSDYRGSSDYERDPYNLKRESFDAFDIIKYHLINENYVNNEEDALIIMSNMSDEWKEEILENYI